MNADLNALVMKRVDGDGELIAWFDGNTLHMRTIEGDEGVRWDFSAKDSEWFMDGLLALQARGRARMEAE